MGIKVEEVKFDLEDSIEMSQPTNRPPLERSTHWAFKVTSDANPNEKYYLDLSGPQFGNVKPCTDVTTYEQMYVDKFIAVAPLGTMKIYFDNMAATGDWCGKIQELRMKAIATAHSAINAW